MGENLLTIKDLSKITRLSESSLRTYLGNYRFDKYIRCGTKGGNRKKVYSLEQDFLDTLADFLWIKRQIQAKKNLENYFNKEVSEND